MIKTEDDILIIIFQCHSAIDNDQLKLAKKLKDSIAPIINKLPEDYYLVRELELINHWI